MPELDFSELRSIAEQKNRYEKQIARLRSNGRQTTCIEEAVSKTVSNISSGARSLVIYGEPQSGKTEMMICLTAKLADDGYRVIIHLLNDSVQLLQQNLDRFQRSALSPAAKNFSDILDPDYSLKSGHHIIFCKKNGNDLAKLNAKVKGIRSKIVIDDEADFASPNARINKNEVAPINGLIGELIASDGIYVGVTATPARLDLNNTFDNDSERWVNFPPHSAYTGQDIFFPIEHGVQYSLKTLPDTEDSPKYLREALLRFLVRVAAININSDKDECFSMLIHTSGKKMDHRSDKKPIDDVMNALSDTQSKKFNSYATEINAISTSLYGSELAKQILRYVVRNCDQTTTIIMNSERDKNVDLKSATSPAALYTFVIGGNIVSRGVTFDNLLSMFFTRDTKHKIQQDTYVQRARMFGSRRSHLTHFELTIPEQLYLDWHRCFVFHRLSLEAIKNNMGSPVWLSDSRIAAVSSSSIDKTNVDIDHGEMSFGIFGYDDYIESVFRSYNDPISSLKALQRIVGKDSLPDYLIRYVEATSANMGSEAVAIHKTSSMRNMHDANPVTITRPKGLFGQAKRDAPRALHHFKIFHNDADKARVVYRFTGNITFLKNMKNAR